MAARRALEKIGEASAVQKNQSLATDAKILSQGTDEGVRDQLLVRIFAVGRGC